ncbi:MAG: hypothetical protein HY667_02040 [Chloroflexi bacterium]|nr:hypothetical protein [Chloroflexota bacterium]
MELKTLALDLGKFKVLEAPADPPDYAPGWYIDPQTGMRLFYDPNTHNFYTLGGGVYIPLGYMSPAPKQVSIGPGERLQISISYKYMGPAISGALERFCMGVFGTFGFNEILVGENTRNLPTSNTPQLYTGSYTFTIPPDVGTDWNDIYAKVYGGSPSLGNPAGIFGYENALVIAGNQPTITEFTIKDFAKV